MPFKFNRNINLAALRIGVDDEGTTGDDRQVAGVGNEASRLSARVRRYLASPAVADSTSKMPLRSTSTYRPRRRRPDSISRIFPPLPVRGSGDARDSRATPPPNPMAPADWNPRFVNGRRISGIGFPSGRASSLHADDEVGGVHEGSRHVSSAARSRTSAPTRRPDIRAPFFRTSLASRSPSAGRGPGRPPRRRRHSIRNLSVVTIIGNLYNDDMILSVAHQFQIHDDTVRRHPTL